MKTKTLLRTFLIATITTIVATSCKKDNTDITPREAQSTQNKKEVEDKRTQVSAYRYWTATEILSDKAVDLYQKGATRDIFSQRPEHQSDYFIEVTYTNNQFWNMVDYKLHFGNKKLPGKLYNEEGQFGFYKDQDNTKTQIDWIKPYEEPKSTFSISTYNLESIQGNQLKLSRYDNTIQTTVHVTFIGSNTKPF